MLTVQLRGTARHFAAVERRLFEVLGGWVPTVVEGDVKVLLRRHSFQHAWHAEMWAGLEPQAQVQEPGQAQAAEVGPDVLAVLGAMASAETTIDRVAGAYRVVLPSLVEAYRGMRDAATPASDGPLVRVLGLVLADQEAALAEGERILDDAPAEAHERALAAQLGAARGMRYRDVG